MDGGCGSGGIDPALPCEGSCPGHHLTSGIRVSLVNPAHVPFLMFLIPDGYL